ncbi:MAG: hypothetical protein WCI41_02735 [bacterium]
MVNQQLLDFIKEQLQKGISKEVISKELLSNGWMSQDVEEGFNALNNPSLVISNTLNIPNPNSNFIDTNTYSNVEKKSKKSFLLVFIFIVFFLASFFPPYSMIGIPLQTIFGVSPSQQEQKFFEEFKREKQMFPMIDDMNNYDANGNRIVPSPDEAKKVDAYNQQQTVKILAYRESNKTPVLLGIIRTLGGPITVFVFGIIFLFFTKNRKYKEKQIQNLSEQPENLNFKKDSILPSKIDVIKSQIILLIEIAVIVSVVWIIFSTISGCRGVGEFCGIGVVYLIFLLGPLLLIFMVSSYIFISKKIKLLKLNNCNVPISFNLLFYFSKLILFVSVLGIFSLIFFK